MTQSTDLPNTGLSGLWNELCDYQRIWFHRTNSYGYPLVHVLDHDGREIARRINSTGHWEWRTHSPERWFPIPDDAIPYEFQSDEELDGIYLDSLDTTVPGGFRGLSI
ncbi:hypothetical protein CWM57_25000 [Klebsiella sp. G-Nf4]|nr:hypothetical protein CWM64_24800 [Klebsiella sp. I-Nf8]PJX67487.1 hypothetical protein CWM57_25000 [Klebsiella sp. G-Nf4]PJX72859.1 hypothetical protein CWM55_23370 [Klebsiella sp. G2-16S-Nf13]PKJ73145.1 hypothetical protein CWM65_25155 [Klebsiella sp. J-Nf11]